MLAEKDEELESMRKELRRSEDKVESLTLENQRLQEQVNEWKAKSRIPNTKPLEHPTKSRPHPRSKASSSKSEIITDSTATEDTATSPHHQNLAESHSAAPPQPTPAPSTASASQPSEPVDIKKKIALMGGVNPFAGFKPPGPIATNHTASSTAASAVASAVRSSTASTASIGSPASNTSGTPGTGGLPGSGHPAPILAAANRPPLSSSNSSASIQVCDKWNEDELREWIGAKIKETLPAGKPWSELLKDGQVLCKLANGVCPGSQIRINAGKFKMMHVENINGYLKEVESFGLPKQAMFTATDLYEDQDMTKVFPNLATLKKLCESKKR
ncbi:calponin domain-containing protein [Polychytrium aggregatum]|uniref:calponin domain-containing protein n=1 Tax=Polychytrium aggregatum TaxID=110093 RepID=UPI0022FED4D4|nr:calponin domain-containing protein [Polychytrium aggregatum]KAI9193254.1 calponin homology domain-containing protein [Polychytrium aggregatum]